MSPTARLHGGDAARQFANEIENAVATKPAAQNNRTGLIKTDKAANRLAQINPKHKNRHWPFLSPFMQSDPNRSPQRGVGHPIIANLQPRQPLKVAEL
jgi:hypothetical protein